MRCVLYKRNCCGTANIDFGEPLSNQKHGHSKGFNEIERTKNTSRMKMEYES